MKKLSACARALIVLAMGILPCAETWAQVPGGELRVNTETAANQVARAVGAAPNGDFVVVWTSSGGQDGDGYGIFGQLFDAAGAPRGGEFRVNTFTAGNQFASAVALDAEGGFIVVWESRYQDGHGLGVFGQRYDPSGEVLGPEFPINTYVTSDQSDADVAIDGAGNFVVVWESYRQDGEYGGVFGQRFDAAGGRVGAEFRVNTATAGGQGLPAVAMQPGGAFVVVWRGFFQGWDPGVFGQRFDAGGDAVGSEFLVRPFVGHGHDSTAVVADGAGNFVVAWSSNDGSGKGVFAQRYDASGAPQGSAFRVNTYTTDSQYVPSMAADASGNFVVTWTSRSQDGDIFGGFGQRFTAAGAPRGAEFQVNAYTTGMQIWSAVASDAAGNFVTAWSSWAQDGHGWGAFAQRFGAGAAPSALPVDAFSEGQPGRQR